MHVPQHHARIILKSAIVCFFLFSLFIANRGMVIAAPRCPPPKNQTLMTFCPSGTVNTGEGCGDSASSPFPEACICCTPEKDVFTKTVITVCPEGYSCTLASTCTEPEYEKTTKKCDEVSPEPKFCCKKRPPVSITASTTPVNPGSSIVIRNPLGGADIPTMIGRVISAFLGMVGAFALLVFVYAGITYLTAAGREEAITRAKDAMKYAAMGLALIVFAYAITSFYFQTLVKGGS